MSSRGARRAELACAPPDPATYAVQPGFVVQRNPFESTLDGSSIRPGERRSDAASPTRPTLVLVWSSAEPGRVGESFCLPRGAVDVPFTIGRSVEPDEGGGLPLGLQQLRPFSRVETGPLRDARVSRRHIGVRLLADGGLLVERLGRGEVTINGHAVERALAEPGDVIEAVGRFTVLYTMRPAWPDAEAWPHPFPFGAADRDGIVGESPAVWALRRQIAAVGSLGEHVLVHGPSGTGKELVVRALHAASPRGGAALVARNAVTIPESLIDAELFGSLRDYPSAGAPDRIGLLGEADNGALYLDELGELPHALQARLMRVMDSGEYQRLGEARRRTCNLRLYGATNRDPEELRHDLLARFIHRLRVPGLDERPEDIPLLARNILRGVARDHPELRARFFCAEGEPRLAPEFVATLVGRSYTGHIRELTTLLWRGLTDSRGPLIAGAPARPGPGRAPRLPEPHTLPEELTREQVVAALAACDGVREQAWRHLRLQSRYQLKRLLKKFDIS